MAKKYYAVKSGYNPGVYETWDECKKQVHGFSGASYKSFPTRQEAEVFCGISDGAELEGCDINAAGDKVNDAKNIAGELTPLAGSKSEAVAYVDGSYDNSTKTFSYGVVLFHGEHEEHFSARFDTPDMIEMRNVSGEIKASERAMQFCIDNDIASIDIYHDYEGIAKWCTGEWKTNKDGTKRYKAFYDGIKGKLKVRFIKVKGHSGDKYNDMADQLAKNAKL